MRIFAYAVLFAAIAWSQPQRQTDEFPTSAGPVRITPIQHASLMLQAGGQVIHVDPVGEQNYQDLPPADLILVTDIHGDHLDVKAIARLRKASTRIMAPEAALKTIPDAEILRNGEKKSFGKWEIEAVPAYNTQRGPAPGRVYHEKGRGNGYVLTYGGRKFYISGDTEGVPEMRALRDIDVAFVCMNLPYTMPPEEAAEAIRAFKPRVVYPYHYRNSDLSVLEKALAGTGIEVRLRNWYR
ncbi:MAG: MBL fold metallo-hydrolase [Bryobacterales bacterium]|nr:MBL fold metallo-hydrolase [Bryobacteraceae bacterium]MDW8130577.1 MBL fold metallo-hydrolase [Bryobacterales bacterium]